MKTRKWVLAATGVMVTLGLVLGAGVIGSDGLSSSAASPGLVSAEVQNEAAVQDFNFTEENINQILRADDALAEYQVFDFSSENINQRLREFEASNKVEDVGLELEPENINQVLREFETYNEMSEKLESRKAHIELDYDPLQKETRFNLPEGSN